MENKELQSSNSKMKLSQKQLFYAIILVSIILIAKIIGAFMTNSLSLLSDSWHLVTDLAALCIDALSKYAHNDTE